MKKQLEQFSPQEVLGYGLLIVIVVGGFTGYAAGKYAAEGRLPFFTEPQVEERNIAGEQVQLPKERFAQEDAVVRIVDAYSPAVVSVVVEKLVPIYERCYITPPDAAANDPFFTDPLLREYFGDFQIPSTCQRGVEQREVGSGTGFIITSDGFIVTNKHVVFDQDANYTVVLRDGTRLTATVIARDPLEDLAVLDVEARDLPVVELGNSDNLRVGQTVIAIGNALGQFENTVSTGIISGLSRTITASGEGLIEELRNIIQTDAAINRGNSGGPLINLHGEVIGINTAIADNGENIGFAISINEVTRAVDSIKKHGEIVYPFLGVRFTTLTPQISRENELPVEQGAWLEETNSVVPDSPAARAGLRQGDIITKLGGVDISRQRTLADVLRGYKVGETVELVVRRGGGTITLNVTLERREF